MKHFFLILILFFAITTGIVFHRFAFVPLAQNYFASPTIIPTVEESPTPVINYPQTLEIPILGITAPIESVGLDPEGRMDVPKNVWNVGWYNLGPKPGEVGSAVIAGHLDSPTGPAIFYTLDQLKVGDEIIIKDENNKDTTFIVTARESYENTEFPIEKVFSRNDKPRLNLITCEGIFDRTSSNYSHRLVIYTEMK